LAQESWRKAYKSISQIIASQKLTPLPSENKPCVLPHITSLRCYERENCECKGKDIYIYIQASTG
jgi:hypothetical protein